MGARQLVERLAETMGATVEAGRQGRSFVVRVESPPGQHWVDGEVHEFVASQYSGPWPTEPLWLDLLARMQFGVAPCGEDCEWWI